MNPITSAMNRHHARCDALFEDAETKTHAGLWDEAANSLGAFRREFDAHLKGEETVLFPAFESATGISSGPTTVMRQEHDRMRALLGQLELALAAHDPEGVDGYASTLRIMMQQHNLKEENVLYPMCDNALGDQAPKIVARLALD